MKKILTTLLWIPLLFTACYKKSDLNIDGKTTDERLKEALRKYNEILVSAPYGWIMTEYTTGSAINGGVTQTGPKAIFTYYMKFEKDNKVSMLSDFAPGMANTFNTSSFDIKATQRPTLVFDTYSYVHVPCDPDGNINNSPFSGGYGFGWGADFEFGFEQNPDELGDTIRLKGNLNSTTVTLIRATKEEQDIFNASGFSAMINWNKILTYFKQFNYNGITFQLSPGIAGKSLNVKYTGHPEILNVRHQFVADKLIFTTPLPAGNSSIQSLTITGFNSNNQTISAKVNGTTDITISGARRPYLPDLTAATRFFNGGLNNPWVSTAGLHVAGVDDAYNIRSLTYGAGAFFAFVYYPQVVRGGGNTWFDVLSPVLTGLDDSYPYLYNNGVVQTYIQGNLIGFFPLDLDGPSGQPSLDQTNDVLASGTIPPEPGKNYGFYVVPLEDGKTFDIVDAGTATAWMNWRHL
ncbi:protein of unknown function [Chitinophaga terrae (ex Kim and Jung 2007)]|uniref:DUF4302 domain-containing protein n=1 Tax=Chitinophaga terrae (ex Kim and Jung 2007) TaxID=408074 RepID=A0A1H3X962_9BACT|nr:DUF4302 domain-containing protein [Chitinophaga terrae (ex Kim and Jung 2007)]MDQ0106822.1 hypothetical protein [Chitinophaga terrae (ex Kim and Jung 2007)]GEP89856.1 hypothetical protein CTE07_15010 [Chitinophaga terrae (ex Kim and Jung 2007)]SDZ95780.1 protein of unknown function [Chitinophaga terrae (ex Kim and Jung 2007)]